MNEHDDCADLGFLQSTVKENVDGTDRFNSQRRSIKDIIQQVYCPAKPFKRLYSTLCFI